MDDTFYGTFINQIPQRRGEVKKKFDETLVEVNKMKDLSGVGLFSVEFSGLSKVSGSGGSAGAVLSGAASTLYSEFSASSLRTLQNSTSIPRFWASSFTPTQTNIFDVMTTSAATSSSCGSWTSAKLVTSSIPSSSSRELAGSGHLTFWSDDSSFTSSYKTSSSSISHPSLYSSAHNPSSSNSIYDSSSTVSSSYCSNSAVYDSSYCSYNSNISSYGSYDLSYGSSLPICSSITLPPSSTYTDPSNTNSAIDHFSKHDDSTYNKDYDLHQMESLQFKMDTNESEFSVKQEELEQDDLSDLQLQFKAEDFDTIYRTIDESSQLVTQHYGDQIKQEAQFFSNESALSSFVPPVAQDFDAFDDLEPISSDHELMIDEMLEDMEEGEEVLFRNFKNEPVDDESSQYEKMNRKPSQEDHHEEEENKEEGEDGEDQEAKGSKKFTILGYWCDQAECQLKDKKLYKDKVALNRHLKSSHGIEAHRCSVHRCGMSFSNKYKLGKHVTTVHGRLNSFTCCLCTCKPFRTFYTFACHNSKFHEHAHYVCTSCTFTGTYRQVMYYHWSSVHEIRRVCAFCDRAFVRKSHYDAHLRTHTQVKPYRCVYPDCVGKDGKQYMSTDRSAMMRHVRSIHFGLPRYLKEQRRQKIVDSRDPHQYIEIVCEDFKS